MERVTPVVITNLAPASTETIDPSTAVSSSFLPSTESLPISEEPSPSFCVMDKILPALTLNISPATLPRPTTVVAFVAPKIAIFLLAGTVIVSVRLNDALIRIL